MEATATSRAVTVDILVISLSLSLTPLDTVASARRISSHQEAYSYRLTTDYVDAEALDFIILTRITGYKRSNSDFTTDREHLFILINSKPTDENTSSDSTGYLAYAQVHDYKGDSNNHQR